eukprot:m.66894 g.66894  ORF g.66894 m.66894 type:complete len:324 (+) comp9836_c0_seq1:234-1205(+)
MSTLERRGRAIRRTLYQPDHNVHDVCAGQSRPKQTVEPVEGMERVVVSEVGVRVDPCRLALCQQRGVRKPARGVRRAVLPVGAPAQQHRLRHRLHQHPGLQRKLLVSAAPTPAGHHARRLSASQNAVPGGRGSGAARLRGQPVQSAHEIARGVAGIALEGSHLAMHRVPTGGGGGLGGGERNLVRPNQLVVEPPLRRHKLRRRSRRGVWDLPANPGLQPRQDLGREGLGRAKRLDHPERVPERGAVGNSRPRRDGLERVPHDVTQDQRHHGCRVCCERELAALHRRDVLPDAVKLVDCRAPPCKRRGGRLRLFQRNAASGHWQ